MDDWDDLICDDCRSRGFDYTYDEDGELESVCEECPWGERSEE